MKLLIAFAALGTLSCAPAQETGAAPQAAAAAPPEPCSSATRARTR